jgi:hypothetical protein
MFRYPKRSSKLFGLISIGVGVLLAVAGVTFVLTRQPAELKVHEWNVSIPLDRSIADASYAYSSKEDQITLTTTQLENLRSQLHGCVSGLHALYFRRDGTKLVEQHPIETLCLPASTDASRQIQQIQSQLRAAAGRASVSNSR